ncbi:methionine-rich copper-binding protein CopC [Pullulanibacillus pueri]|uniref:CopC domain-containing protein n=1 Tax=Pullulanibacillus pueri TaxID=1437324 RepID=A0A8J3EMX5_9BACL|nr:copper resistance protein CopC [Pullulanibacillus pueri]MBM7680522.1 methionine-rich copper-binding protein CopC [Pullulanibacillus pueri]GGH86106.1 hypothetical protein GCM10007096_33040 [Pullulanibacillus pueri]
MLKKSSLLIALLFIGLFLPKVGFAHSELVSSTPKQGGEVDEPVSAITLNFGAAVEEFVDLTLTDQEGHTYALEKPIIKEKKVTLLTKKPLESGQYKLYWHLVGIDTHKVHGYMTFGVNQPAPKPSDIKASNESAAGDSGENGSAPAQDNQENRSSTLYIIMVIILTVLIIVGLFFISQKRSE